MAVKYAWIYMKWNNLQSSSATVPPFPDYVQALGDVVAPALQASRGAYSWFWFGWYPGPSKTNQVTSEGHKIQKGFSLTKQGKIHHQWVKLRYSLHDDANDLVKTHLQREAQNKPYEVKFGSGSQYGDLTIIRFSEHRKNDDHRAKMVLNSLHAYCELVLDCLERDSHGHWRLEFNTDPNNQDYGDLFQSLLHLHFNSVGRSWPYWNKKRHI